jgi:hypothetical protein
VLLGVPARGMSAAGGWPDAFGARGLVVALAGLTMALAGQVAFVTGVLALWRALRCPAVPEELRLVQRRLGIALVAGGVVLAGQAVQAAALQPLISAWWLALAIPAVLVPGLALGGAARGLSRAVALTPSVAPLPRGFPMPLVVAIGVAAVGVIAVGSTFAEHSLAEGLTRGVIEAMTFALCFAVLGRRLGIRH